jgi:hypothetical protein
VFSGAISAAPENNILHLLFQTLKNKNAYDLQKQNHLDEIKKQFKIPQLTDIQIYNINNQLQQEFQSFKIDSAIFYLENNLQIAENLQNRECIYETKLTLSYMYWQAGKFFEALQLLASLNSVQAAKISPQMLSDYYEAYKRIYKYYANSQNDLSNSYFEKSSAYRDSLMSVINCKTKKYKVLTAEILTENNQTQKAAEILEELISKSLDASHDRAVLANILADIYKTENNIEKQKKYLAVSVVCDIKNSVKENTSMLSLALLLYENGEIDNAYHCLQSAMDDAVFCNARFRTYEIAKIFPIIDTAYQKKTAKQQHELKIYLLIVSVLSLFLILAIIVIARYLRRIAKIRKELYRTNVKLQSLNSELQTANLQLLDVNQKLSEANLIKETYLAKFIDLCSNYIEKLDNYRRSLNRFVRDGKMEELFEELKFSKFIKTELSDFYTNFDETFLKIYPTFIDDFNAFFPESERQVVKPSEILNTELRVFALIRLGINDSSKIALFLRCSITTIYTYRSKLKNKSLFKENLEEQVMKIV